MSEELQDRNQATGMAPWTFRRKWTERSLYFCAVIVLISFAYAFYSGDLEVLKITLVPTFIYAAGITASYGGMALIEDVYKRLYNG